MISECINHTHSPEKYHTLKESWTLSPVFHKPVCGYQPVASNLAVSALQHVMRRALEAGALVRRGWPNSGALTPDGSLMFGFVWGAAGALQAIGRTTKGRTTGGGA